VRLHPGILVALAVLWAGELAADAEAAKAQVLRARQLENLSQAAAAYKEAYAQDPSGAWGGQAMLELGKQEYALGHHESAMILLAQLPEELLEGESRGQLLYWRAQCRLVLKGLLRAQEDFESFIKGYPDHPLADSARLAMAAWTDSCITSPS
jgi:TolA-binding protein